MTLEKLNIWKNGTIQKGKTEKFKHFKNILSRYGYQKHVYYLIVSTQLRCDKVSIKDNVKRGGHSYNIPET